MAGGTSEYDTGSTTPGSHSSSSSVSGSPGKTTTSRMGSSDWNDPTTNRLTDASFDPYSRQPSYKWAAVDVRALEPGDP